MPRSPSHSRAHGVQLALLTALGLVGAVSRARADQFTIVDNTWSDTKDVTTDSHYFIAPSAATPKNLVSPVDYSKGSVHIVLDVNTKPAGDTPTDFQVCFEGNPAYVCTDIGPTYTTTGRVVWSTPVSKFYVGSNGQGAMGIDYSKGVSRVDLILKDTHNGKPQGDPKFYPTDLHIEVVWISPGATYMPPTDGGHADAGASDAGGSTTDAGHDLPGSSHDAGSGTTEPISSFPPLDAGLSGSGAQDAAAGSAPRTDAHVAVNDAGTVSEPTDGTHDGSGCSAARGSAQTGWSLGLLSLLLVGGQRRRARRKR